MLHAKDQQVKAALRKENIQLKTDNQGLRETAETLKIQTAKLHIMVFGRRRKPPTGHYLLEPPKAPVSPRAKASYRRFIPPAYAITSQKLMPLLRTLCD